MIDLISYTLENTLELLVSPYFRYSLGVLIFIGILGLIYRIAGKGK